MRKSTKQEGLINIPDDVVVEPQTSDVYYSEDQMELVAEDYPFEKEALIKSGLLEG